MGILSKLFGSSKSKTIRTTHDNPFRIKNPIVGFCDLGGSNAKSMIDQDALALGSLFDNLIKSEKDIPKCNVLFLYCELQATGLISGGDRKIRDVIKESGALIAVVAINNDPDFYMKAIHHKNDWSANIVLTIDRRGDKFTQFFKSLFSDMLKGESMLMSWVKHVPQIPGYDHANAPETAMLAEAGHLTFK